MKWVLLVIILCSVIWVASTSCSRNTIIEGIVTDKDVVVECDVCPPLYRVQLDGVWVDAGTTDITFRYWRVIEIGQECEQFYRVRQKRHPEAVWECR